MRFWRFISVKIFVATLASLPLFACSSPQQEVNKLFEQKYGEEIRNVKKQRAAASRDPEQQGVMIFSTPPSAEDVAKEKIANGYYPYADITKFGEKAPQNYAPNGEVYQQSQKSDPANSLPPDMFYVTYKTDLHQPFRRVGTEFDSIQIPQEDIYGVKTEMSLKAYLLAGNNALQRNIDEINNARTKEDFEISETLIKEQKQLKQKEKMAKIFGKEKTIEIAFVSKKDDADKKEVAKK